MEILFRKKLLPDNDAAVPHYLIINLTISLPVELMQGAREPASWKRAAGGGSGALPICTPGSPLV